MTTRSRPATAGAYARAVAEEVRAVSARRHVSGSELARRAGRNQTWVSVRMRGEVAIDMDDLEVIASALEVEPQELLPAPEVVVRHRGLEPLTRWFEFSENTVAWPSEMVA